MIGNALFNLRNRLLSSAGFRAFAQKMPFGQRVANSHATQLFRLFSGFIHSQVVLACVRLGLFERLREGPVRVATLAAETGIAPERLRHLLRAAAALRLLEARSGDEFGLGVLGAAVTDNESLQAMVEHHALLYQDLADPVPLFEGAAGKTRLAELWPYAGSDAPESLDESAVGNYTRLMAASQQMIAEQVVAAFSMRGRRRLLDIGGGAGTFAMAMARRWPDLQVTIAELPAVAEIARREIAAAGLDARIDVVAVDAAEGGLPRDCDVVSLVRILHDHDDDRALAILRAARGAVADSGVLLVAEPMAAATAAGSLIDAYFNVYLLAMGSGRPRTRTELAALLLEAGFGAPRDHRARVPLVTSVLSAHPVL